MANEKPVVLLTGNPETIKTMGEQFLGFNIDSPESPGIVLTRDPEINFDYNKVDDLFSRVKFWLLPAAFNIIASKAKNVKAGWHSFDLILPSKHAENLANAMHIWSGRLIAIHWDDNSDCNKNTDIIDQFAFFQTPFITITDSTVRFRNLVTRVNMPIMVIRPEVIIDKGVDALLAGIESIHHDIMSHNHQLTIKELG